MPFNLNNFRAKMSLDGARPNLFQVRMNLPAFATGGVATQAQSKLSFMIKSAQLPESTIGVVPVFYFGRELKYAGNRTFPDWTVTVINDEDFSIREAFEQWMNAINSHAANERNQAAYNTSLYTADLFVDQFAKNNQQGTGFTNESGFDGAIKTYKFVGAFPTNVSAIDLDWGSNDTIEEFSVTFSYQWWESAGSSDKA
jgi:hypothetical protein